MVGRDLALLVLAADIAAPAATLRAEPVRPGERVTALGYGPAPGAPDDGALRAKPTRVRRGDRRRIITDPATCDGDSGGPLVDDAGRVVAIASTRDPRGCGVGPSLFVTVTPATLPGATPR
jgi:S1-C subfamily serine protease